MQFINSKVLVESDLLNLLRGFPPITKRNFPTNFVADDFINNQDEI